ncbi:uncharacterized protein SCHCODRAFT_02257545 [Schizophyllum commune H4-8]|uniref:uncharacterized protein n=1 Tax=Schizophyllum commune (strain H4-8 / FGSC 9210) TaxID=578458 RepID=UPI0021610721|nr:uncharacterized protein SCHCODRAFT_02257545 [Schizophyllum commune H4-8]KAI5893629.1 hypothetical protein SCHCODRAFT_02257545 [Schizophyllum commune H4-8]
MIHHRLIASRPSGVALGRPPGSFQKTFDCPRKERLQHRSLGSPTIACSKAYHSPPRRSARPSRSSQTHRRWRSSLSSGAYFSPAITSTSVASLAIPSTVRYFTERLPATSPNPEDSFQRVRARRLLLVGHFDHKAREGRSPSRPACSTERCAEVHVLGIIDRGHRRRLSDVLN